MSTTEGDDGAWTAVAMTLVDGVFEAPDRTAAVDHILGTLQPVQTREDLMSLGREVGLLRARASDPDRQVACTALATCLYDNMLPMRPPLRAGLVACVTLVLMIVAVATGHLTAALGLALVEAACVLRMGVFWIRMRRADPSDPAVLPTVQQLLALQCVRTLPER